MRSVRIRSSATPVKHDIKIVDRLDNTGIWKSGSCVDLIVSVPGLTYLLSVGRQLLIDS